MGNLRSFAGLDRLALAGGDESGVTVAGVPLSMRVVLSVSRASAGALAAQSGRAGSSGRETFMGALQ